MKKVLMGLFLLIVCISCDRLTRMTQEKRKMKVTLQVIPEGENAFSIAWTDTLGQKGGYSLINRPVELWCILKSKHDTVGYYKGLSSPGNSTHFTTRDSTVEVLFMTGYNTFSEKLTVEFVKSNDKPFAFDPIYINIKRDLRRDLEFVLSENQVD